MLTIHKNIHILPAVYWRMKTDVNIIRDPIHKLYVIFIEFTFYSWIYIHLLDKMAPYACVNCVNLRIQNILKIIVDKELLWIQR